MEEQNGIIGEITCPICGGTAQFKTELRTLSYRNEDYAIECYFYNCDSCEEGFTTDQLDDKTLRNVGLAYRQKHPDGPSSPYDELI